MRSAANYPLSSYKDPASGSAVFCLRAKPAFSPIDVNVAFLVRSGWNQSVDRLRFHLRRPSDAATNNPLAEVIGRFGPHLLIRRLDREEDHFASVRTSIDGEILVLSNDAEFARTFFRGVFLEYPPSFRTLEDFEISEEWLSDQETNALFAGMLAGAQGWDPSHGIPDNVRQSLDEARKSLEIANYRSCVVMSRRTLEAVLMFGYERLLKTKPVNNKGRTLTLDDMIRDFRNRRPPLIPEHLLHVADSVRLIGNVPGAHAADITDYRFSRSDAEFALYATTHFLEQYFSKIDTEVNQYYTLTIELAGKTEENRTTGA